MSDYYNKVQQFLIDLDCDIIQKDKAEELFVVNKLDAGISSLVVDCEDPILVFEQYLFDLNVDNIDVFRSLLQKNRDIIHGAFALDETGVKVLYRDTLQIENLDFNEFQGVLNSLELLLSEYSNQIIAFSKL